jgi:ABC-type polysaccharide/polyol phosphate export permease
VFITLFRELLLYGRMPGMGMWLSGAVMAALVFALGAWVFSRLQKTFIYYI